MPPNQGGTHSAPGAGQGRYTREGHGQALDTQPKLSHDTPSEILGLADFVDAAAPEAPDHVETR